MNPLEELQTSLSHLQHSFEPVTVIGPEGFGLTQYTLWMLIILTLVAVLVLMAARRVKMIPEGRLAGIVEFGYDFIRKDIGEGIIGQGSKKHIPFLASIFFFIFVSNFVGLIPGCKTPTGSLSITWALAIASFVYFNYSGVKAHGGWSYVKSFAPSGLPLPIVPIVWAIEIVSTALRALTLALRLYANMFAGHMVLGVFALLSSVFVTAAIQNSEFLMALPTLGWMFFLLVMYALECLVAFLQAYVFTLLSAVYISSATAHH